MAPNTCSRNSFAFFWTTASSILTSVLTLGSGFSAWISAFLLSVLSRPSFLPYFFFSKSFGSEYFLWPLSGFDSSAGFSTAFSAAGFSSNLAAFEICAFSASNFAFSAFSASILALSSACFAAFSASAFAFLSASSFAFLFFSSSSPITRARITHCFPPKSPKKPLLSFWTTS